MLPGLELRERSAVVRLEDEGDDVVALAHLLENAAQYSPKGSTITATVHVEAKELRISIRDSGPGIAPHDLQRIFDRFYRGSAAGQYNAGTGMGLAITRGLLTAEGGRVWAENHPDGGAEFSIVVPVDVRPAVMEPASR